MKFKCKMSDPGSMRDFCHVVSNVSRMSKQCIVRLTTESLCLNVADDSMPMVWCKLAQNHFFVDYLVAGKSEEYNEIYMELATSMLVKSITSLKTAAKCVKIKLTNKQQPCLTFEIELSSVNESRFCVHDVPVTIIPQKKWKEYHEPNILQYDISLEMPLFKHLRSVIDRIKNMSPILVFSVDSSGILALKANTETANISVNFPNMTVIECKSHKKIVSASVDIKKFHAFLAWDAIHPSSIKCNIVDEKVININLNLENYLKTKYYIPAVAL